MSTPHFGKAAKKFTDAGIIGKWLLPIAPVGAVIGKGGTLNDAVLGKAPGRFNERMGAWSGLGGSMIVTGVRKDDWHSFQEWPTPNVGIIGKAFPGIDNDAGSEKARVFVENVIAKSFGNDVVFAERIRGKGPRRLYAFKAYDPEDRDSVVRTRHITYRLKGDETEHKLDVIGLGGQYVATGTHPSGDKYGWSEKASLMDADFVRDLTKIDNSDMGRFIEDFTNAVQNSGGEIMRATGGKGSGHEDNVEDLKPVMSINAVLDGLDKIPNDEETFLHREEFVSALAAVRAALGKESLRRDVEDDIREWATRDPQWCDDDYFDKVWRSLDKVRVPQDSLDRLFRKNGVRTHVAEKFDDRAKEISREITKGKAKKKEERSSIFQKIASRYLFGRLSLRGGTTRYAMRDRWDVDHDWPTLDWWKMELSESDQTLLNEIQENDTYLPNKVGLANFLRDFAKTYPENFYSVEVMHPAYDRGDIVDETMPDGSVRRGVNMRYLSQTIIAARKAPQDPARAQADVDQLLDFVNRLFGPMAKYELDTLAYMAQTCDRPGSMLFLVGDSGVGKSIWMNLLSTMFDGTGPTQGGVIDGSKLHNENARRFILGTVEGARILTIKELPEGAGSREMAHITSTLKQLVDPGAEADYMQIEIKGQQARPARNFARVQISSNYGNALHVEAQDRRIFYVKAAITLEDRPDEDYYAELHAIKDDPARLAAFWRYLKSRDIGDYSRYTAPPVSNEKAERIIVDQTDATTRHAAAAIYWIKCSGRDAFTSLDFVELMTRCAAAEYANLGGDRDGPAKYTLSDEDGKTNPTAMRAVRTIDKRVAVKLDRDIRSSKDRFPTIYVNAKRPDLYADLMVWSRNEVLDFMEDEAARKMPPHPMATYRVEK